jgi:replicative DNA helicase
LNDQELPMSRNKPKPYEPKPKFSIEAEQATIGGVLLVPEAFFRVADIVGEQDFYRRDHQMIWRAIKELQDRGHPPDAVTLGEWFEHQGIADLVGGSKYILELANTTPSAANIRAYAEIVQRHGVIRRLEDGAVEIQRLANDHGDLTPQECVAQAQKLLLDAIPRDARAVVTAKAAVKKSLKRIMERYQAALDGITIFGLSTGLPDLDEMIGGLEKGLLHVLAGPPSAGKSMLAGWIVRWNARLKKRIALFTIEMPAEGWTDRLIATQAHVNLKHIKRPINLAEEEWPKITAAIEAIQEWKILLDESSQQTLETIVARATQMHMEEPLDLIVIDHLGLMTLPKGDENQPYRIGLITKGLKKLAKDLQVPILLLSQLTKKGLVGKPSSGDLRDSGCILEDADVVMLAWRPAACEGVDSTIPKGYTEIIIVKGRDAGDGEVYYEAQLSTMSVYPCARIVIKPKEERGGNHAAPEFTRRSKTAAV